MLVHEKMLGFGPGEVCCVDPLTLNFSVDCFEVEWDHLFPFNINLKKE